MHEKRLARGPLAAALIVLLAAFAMPNAGSRAQAAPVPPNRKISAKVVRTIAPPAEQAMHMPTDVAVDRRGRVYVVDGTRNRILRFAFDGKFERVITGSGDAAFDHPVGLGIDGKDRLWVADSRHHRVVVLTADAELVETIDLPAPTGGRPSDPTDVAISADLTRSYIVDNNNHRVLIRDNGAKLLQPMGGYGISLGQFEYPFMAAIAANGDVYVTEAIGSRLQRISPRNQWAGQVSRFGIELGQLYRPKGVAVDAVNRVYVSDSTTKVVQVFDPRGNIAGVLTDETGKLLKFEHPMGMCFDLGNRLCVVELQANRVAIVALPPEWLPATRPESGGGK